MKGRYNRKSSFEPFNENRTEVGFLPISKLDVSERECRILWSEHGRGVSEQGHMAKGMSRKDSGKAFSCERHWRLGLETSFL